MPFLVYQYITINKLNNDEIPLRIMETYKNKMFLNQKKHSFLKKNMNAPSILRYLERVSLCNSLEVKGSMTIEAALVFPLFLFLILSLLSAINIICLQSNMTMALRETGLPMSAYGYVFRTIEHNNNLDLSGEITNIGFSQIYVAGEIKNYLGKNYLDHSPLTRGSNAMNFSFSSILDSNDVIDLVALYQVEPEFNMLPIPPLRLFSRFYARAWTGYDVEGGQSQGAEQEINVFITPEGDAYHKYKDCSHLNLTIQGVSGEQITQLYNESGEKYSPCLNCKERITSGKVFITSYGNKYHRSINCSGIKRTIEVIPISKAEGRYPCSRCSKN